MDRDSKTWLNPDPKHCSSYIIGWMQVHVSLPGYEVQEVEDMVAFLYGRLRADSLPLALCQHLQLGCFRYGTVSGLIQELQTRVVKKLIIFLCIVSLVDTFSCSIVDPVNSYFFGPRIQILIISVPIQSYLMILLGTWYGYIYDNI
jgi:hypothetical protein